MLICIIRRSGICEDIMSLCKVNSIVVTGNVIEEKEKMKRKNIKYMKGKPSNIKGQMICKECNTAMESNFGQWNGYTDCDEDGNNFRHYSYECGKFHVYSWTEKI